MPKCYKILLFILLLAFVLVGAGCGQSNREYLDDLRISLQDGSGTIIIREWRWLQGSGAEVYFERDGKTELLGQCSGADDGYCPFQAGRYTMEENGNEITIRWLFNTVEGKELWHSKTFQIG